MADKLWEAIPGWEMYRISSDGSVLNTITNKLLSHSVDNHGYVIIQLQQKCKRKNFKLHRLLAVLFIPNPDNLPVVNHKDGNKLNNELSNLEWVTYLYNNVHAIETGLRTKTSNKPVIATELATGIEREFGSGAECARYIDTSSGNVSRILIGRRKTAKGYSIRYKEVI